MEPAYIVDRMRVISFAQALIAARHSGVMGLAWPGLAWLGVESIIKIRQRVNEMILSRDEPLSLQCVRTGVDCV